MGILIITEPGDVHANAVCWALERMGRSAKRWVPETLGRAPVSLRFSNADVRLELTGPDGAIDGSSIRAVWLRRWSMPAIPASLTEGDRIVARRETDAFLRGACFALRPDTFWANAPAAQRTASSKARQLAAARKVGLSIPETVMTNDAEVARAFLRSIRGRAIYKGFYPAVWSTGSEKTYVTRTAFVTEHDLAEADSLRFSPGIFQEFVPKRCELRVSVFGRTCIAARITEQDELDWRKTYAMKLAPAVLPSDIEARLFAFMDELGIVMGAVDLIVTEKGEYVLLEVNEQGQFLWVEGANPEISLLEPFVRFLAAGDPAFRWSPRKPEIRFEDYEGSAAGKEFEERELKGARPGGGLVVPEGGPTPG